VLLVDKGKSLTVAAPGLLPPAPRSEEAAPSRTIAIDAQPAHGKLTAKPDGGFVYVPDKAFTGSDTFTFHVTGGTAPLTGTATLVVR
jgi:hypothetical protein